MMRVVIEVEKKEPGCKMSSPAETRDAQVTQFRSNLELQSEANLSLTVRNLRTLVFDLTKGAVAYVAVWAVELGSIERVEVIDRENGLEAFSQIEVLSGIQAFVIERRSSQLPIDPLCMAEHILC